MEKGKGVILSAAKDRRNHPREKPGTLQLGSLKILRFAQDDILPIAYRPSLLLLDLALTSVRLNLALVPAGRPIAHDGALFQLRRV